MLHYSMTSNLIDKRDPAGPRYAWAPIYGQWLTIRPIVPADAEIETAFLEGLSAETRYLRFHGGGVRADAATIKRFTDIDYRSHMALVATVMLDDAELQVGVARYVVAEDGSAEFAIVVADQWQGCGLGQRLMSSLIAHAIAAGVPALYGDVLAANISMLALMRKLGFTIEAHPDGGELRRARLPLT